MILIMMWLCL